MDLIIQTLLLGFGMVGFVLIVIFWDTRGNAPRGAVHIAGAIAIGILLIYGAWIGYTAPPPIYTGEIIKFYANGTALLDNGTMIAWPPGCPPCGG